MRKNFTAADSNYFTGIENLPQGTIVSKSGVSKSGRIFKGHIYLSSLRRTVEIFVKQTEEFDKGKQIFSYAHFSIPFENIDRIIWKEQLIILKE